MVEKINFPKVRRTHLANLIGNQVIPACIQASPAGTGLYNLCMIQLLCRSACNKKTVKEEKKIKSKKKLAFEGNMVRRKIFGKTQTEYMLTQLKESNVPCLFC